MSTENINLGEAELEIMKVIWKAKKPMSSSEIGEAVKNREWKRTTIATFLARLTDKGALSAEKCGKSLYYTPLMSAREYKRLQVKSLVKNLFDGSSRDLVAALFEEQSISEKDIEELREIFAKNGE